MTPSSFPFCIRKVALCCFTHQPQDTFTHQEVLEFAPTVLKYLLWDVSSLIGELVARVWNTVAATKESRNREREPYRRVSHGGCPFCCLLFLFVCGGVFYPNHSTRRPLVPVNLSTCPISAALESLGLQWREQKVRNQKKVNQWNN